MFNFSSLREMIARTSTKSKEKKKNTGETSREICVATSDEHSLSWFKEELEKFQRICANHQSDILRKDETLRKLVAELKKFPESWIGLNVVYDSVIDEDGIVRTNTIAVEKNRQEREKEIPIRRAAAIERNRIEYENRVGTSVVDIDDINNEGYDEIDS